MPLLIQYLLKLSIALALVYLFYQLLLRRLTFYAANRWYLLFYTAISLVIPLVNITPLLNERSLDNNSIVRLIPAVDHYASDATRLTDCPDPFWFTQWNKWQWLQFALLAVAAILFVQLCVKLISFARLRKQAQLIYSAGVKLFHVDRPIIPFSFGNAVYMNFRHHDEADLKEIVQHEFVHVRQRHTVDILWSELLCIINWYNPFAWMLKAAIRQNLEFIADNHIIQQGVDRKHYQYLLLKVTGHNQFSVASQFNFSSLKKRIVMMNKMKSAKIHLLRFLFLLPLMAVVLVSFRGQKQAPPAETKKIAPVADTVPDARMKNEKGYSISIKDNRGNCTVVVVDGTGKVIDQVPVVKWNEKAEYYAEKYGELPPPPPPAPPVPPAPPQLPENVQSINAHHNKVTVKLKDGSIEKYDFNNPGDKEKFETKYGPLPPPPPPPMPPARGISFVEAPGAVGINASYPAVPAPPVMPAVGVAPAPDLVPGVREFRGEEEILLLITPKTTQQELDALVAAMKDKGIVLTWDLVDFKNGKLFNISGHLEADDGQSKFSASDFTRVIVSRVPASDKNHFRIRTYGRAVI